MAPIVWHSVDHSLDECIKCNICTSYCPVSAVTDLFPGPSTSAPRRSAFARRTSHHSPDHSADYCSGCRVCNEVCPTGVKIAELNARARADIVADHGLPLRNRLLGRNDVLGRLGNIAPGLANFALQNPLSRLAAEKVMRIARQAPLPSWSTSGSFRAWLTATRGRRLKSPRKVVYYHGCATMYYEPFIGKAAVAVFEHNGYEVIVPEQNCCGLPLLSNGEFPAARSYHKRQCRPAGGLCAGRVPHRRHQHQLHPHPQGRGAGAAGHDRRGHHGAEDGHLGYLRVAARAP